MPRRPQPAPRASRAKPRPVSLPKFEEESGYLIRRAHQIAVAMFYEMSADIDITPVQYAALLSVAATPGDDQRQIAARIGIDRTTMNDVAKRLANKNWVLREGGRGRQLHLTITDVGLRKIEQVAARIESHHQRLLSPLRPVERKAFIGALKRIVSEFGDISRPSG